MLSSGKSSDFSQNRLRIFQLAIHRQFCPTEHYFGGKKEDELEGSKTREGDIIRTLLQHSSLDMTEASCAAARTERRQIRDIFRKLIGEDMAD